MGFDTRDWEVPRRCSLLGEHELELEIRTQTTIQGHRVQKGF
jgi:hypothetical protein